MIGTKAPRDIETAWAQGRLGELHPVAVMDIGSNSVRQMIYEGLSRAPSVLFNEKVLCGLGKGIATTGRLNDEAVERALAAIRRFKELSRQAHVEDTHILATAAAREAVNGPQFISAVEEIMQTPVELLTGRREAEYSALGVVSGFYKPNGIAGDMGGGSLELIGIAEQLGEGETLQLGGLRLQEVSGGDLDAARKIARKTLAEAVTTWPGKSRNFYAIGGTWRALARLHMDATNYPMGVIHQYELSADEMLEFCNRVVLGELNHVLENSRVSKNRRQLLPYGAVVMAETILRFKPRAIVMSSLGVREGYLYSQLSAAEQKKDPLIASTQDLAILRARSPRHSVELTKWTDHVFKVLGMDESENERRYRHAACYLADLAWRAHNDFRADQSLATIANAGFVAIDHDGRAFISLANFHRYQGLSAKVMLPKIAEIASARTLARARVLGAIFRVIYLFSASMEGMVPQIGFERIGKNEYEIIIPKEHADLVGERPLARIHQLGKEISANISVRIA